MVIAQSSNHTSAGSCCTPHTQTVDLLPLVYRELRQLAEQKMAGELSDHTLQATALVHEAYLRLLQDPAAQWENRGHFFAAAARAMRRILVEWARRRGGCKRGGGRERTVLDDLALAYEARSIDLLALDEALDALRAHDARKSEIVTLRFFAGLSIEQTAEALGISHATVERDWTYARAWLHHKMSHDGPSGSC